MADGLNKVFLLGNLGQDAELKSTRSGAVMNFSVACTETYLDRDRQKKERVEWVKCVLWGKRAEGLAQYMTKGTRVMVEGKLQSSSYQDRDGNKRYKTEVVVANIILCGSRGAGGGGSSGGKRSKSSDEYDGSTGGSYPDDMYGSQDGDDDDIPF